MRYPIISFFVALALVLVSCAQPSAFSEQGSLSLSSSRSEESVLVQPAEKTYAEFLEAILTRESSIDTTMGKEYARDYFDPSYMVSYPIVITPGRVYRKDDGNYEDLNVTLRGYFEAIGVGHLYDSTSTDPAPMLKTMQYAVINFLGFIGYQFSEADLQVLGYYNFARDAAGHPIYYSDVPVSNWAHGVREKLMQLKQPDGSVETVLVTDVNRWGGTFTGKNDIHSLEDFKTDKADSIAKDHFEFKYNNIERLLKADGHDIKDFIGTTLYWDKLDPKLNPPKGRPNAVVVTYSGLLGGAHLRGAQGVYDLLVNHKNAQDETGTAILEYIDTFAGYETPWGN